MTQQTFLKKLFGTDLDYINDADGGASWFFPSDHTPSLNKDKVTVINFSSENWGENCGDAVSKYLNERSINNFIVLTSDPTAHQITEKVFYFPYWYFWSIENFGNVDKGLSNNRKYLISCANFNARNHRIHNYLKLKNKPYFNECCITMGPNNVSNRDDEYKLTVEEEADWKSNKFIEFFKETERRDSVINFPMFTDSYLNIISETTANIPCGFMSEKTWKPIASEQLFLMLGNPGLMATLKEHGVDIYDDWIDHKYYDQELDFVTRVDKMHKLLDALVKDDIVKLFNTLSDRRLANRQNFMNGSFGNKYLEEIKCTLIKNS